MQRFGLRDDQWERIKDFLPGREGHVGGNAVDNRLFVEAILYRYLNGNPLGVTCLRFRRLEDRAPALQSMGESGVLNALQVVDSDHDNEYMMIDDVTIVRAHQHSAGARKKTAPQRSADRAVD